MLSAGPGTVADERSTRGGQVKGRDELLGWAGQTAIGPAEQPLTWHAGVC